MATMYWSFFLEKLRAHCGIAAVRLHVLSIVDVSQFFVSWICVAVSIPSLLCRFW